MDQFRPHTRWVLVRVEGAAAGATADTISAVAVRGASAEFRVEDAVPRSAQLDACYSRVDGLLDGLGVQLDSDVAAVCADQEVVLAVYAHRATPTAGLRLQLAARWPFAVHSLSAARMQADRRALPARRLDLEHTPVNAGFVVLEKDKWKDNVENGGTSPDMLAAFSHDMITYMISMVNATSNVSLLSTYGQVKRGAVPTQGLMAMLVRNELEISGSPIIMSDDPVRLKHYEYTNFWAPLRTVIVFRAPPLSYEYNVFTLPFPASVWTAAGVMMLLCAALLALVLRSETALGRLPDDHHTMHAGDAALMAVAAVCQQGYSLEMRSIPGRIVVLMMLMLLLLLYTCYSASIVVLMQSSSSKISHFKDLLDTHMKVGLVNIPFVIPYVSSETEPVRRRVWTDKILDKGRSKQLYSFTEGVRKVRTEYFAFCGFENNIYGAISRTWTEEEKCGLMIIGRDFIIAKDPQMVLRKSSHNTKALKIMLRRMVERGTYHRYKTKYSFARPTCSNNAAVFSSVSLTDVRGAFFTLLSLVAFSAAVLVAEMAWHRRRARSQGRAATRKVAGRARGREAFTAQNEPRGDSGL